MGKTTMQPCYHCDKPVRIDKPHWAVALWDGIGVVSRDYWEGKDEGSDMGCFAIGPECRHKYPLAFKMEGGA